MPSGAKKRKAAKKKKQVQAIEAPSRSDSFLARAHGEEDLNRDDKESDIIQVTTSASDADNVTASTIESVVKEKGKENLCVVDEKDTASDTVVEIWEENLGDIVDKATISEVLMETGSEKRDEAASAISNGNSLENTDAKASATI